MKRNLTAILMMALVVFSVSAVSNKSKIYINPGHGGHDSDDRPVDLPTALGYTTSDRFYESDGTLTRGKFLQTFLTDMGYSVKMSRTTNNSSDDLALSTIAAQSNSYGGYFISLHSNGANASANYITSLYSGTRTANSTENVSGSAAFALASAKWQDNNNLTDKTYSTPRALNDYAFQGWSLGVLRTNTQVGYLTESWFHDYRPELLRLKSDQYNKYLAWQIARAYLENPIGNGSAIKGCVIGDIRDLSANCGYSGYTVRNRDAYLAVNYATVELINASGTVVQTTTTDKYSNGVYGFFGVTAGTYTVRVSKSGYATQTATVTVSNGASALKRFDLVKGSSTGISVTPASLNFGSIAVGTSSSLPITITGTSLSSSISVSSSNSNFKVDATSVDSKGGKINVTFSPTTGGVQSGTISLVSGSYKANVSVTGTGKSAPLAFTEGWNLSETSGKKESWLPSYANARNMDFGNGKLYVVDAVNGVIKVVNAQTGAYIKSLNMTGVEGGALKVIDVKYIDGKIFASNVATTSGDVAQPLKVYVWDNDDAAPRVLLNTTNYDGKARCGDCLSFYGTLADGYIFFAAGSNTEQSEVIRYKVTNGVCETTPSYVTPLVEGGDAGSAVKLGLSPRVIPESETKYWAIGQQYYPTHFNDGIMDASFSSTALNKVVHGNCFDSFTYKGTTYGLATSYSTTGTLSGGHVVLTDATNGWASCEAIGSYPPSGLGSTRNTSMSTSIASAVNGDNGVEMWVLVHNQGLAYYKSGTVPSYTINSGDVTPTITATTKEIDFGTVKQSSAVKSFGVLGSSLTSDISISITGNDADKFSISASTISKSVIGATINVTYTPSEMGSHTASLVITSKGANTITIPIKGATGELENFITENGLQYYLIPSVTGGTHAGEKLIVLDPVGGKASVIPDPYIQQYLVSKNQVRYWNYTTQRTNGFATIGADGHIKPLAGHYAFIFQNSAETETEGTEYTGANIIDFSKIGEYGDDNGSTFTGVTDLTGLAYFKNIKTLGVSRKKYADAGYQSYSQLKDVDLSMNTALTTVDLGYNQLSKIDLSKNKALANLNVPHMKLCAINLSSTTPLAEINTDDNFRNAKASVLQWQANGKYYYAFYLRTSATGECADTLVHHQIDKALGATMADDGFKLSHASNWYAANATTGNEFTSGQELTVTNAGTSFGYPEELNGNIVVVKVVESVAPLSVIPSDMPTAVAYDYNILARGTQKTKFFLKVDYPEIKNEVLRGDVNMDGNVDVSDVTTLINYILGNNPSPFNLNAADIDNNHSYDVSDVTALISLIIQ